MINPFIFIIICQYACTFAVYLVCSVIFSISGGALEDLTAFLLRYSIWCNLVFYAVVIIAKRRNLVYDKFKYDHQLKHWPAWKIAGAVAAGPVLGFVFSNLVSLIPGIYSTYDSMVNTVFDDQPIILVVIVVVILGPIAEEIIFRFMTFGRMKFYMGSRWAIVLSSLLFGLYHGNLAQFIYCTLIGIILSFVYDKSGNLWITIAMHMAINLLGIAGYF